MRLESIHAINADKQSENHSKQNVGTLTDKSTSKVLFEEYLKARLQQVSTPEITRHAENQIAGLLLGYVSPLRITYKSEPELEISAS